MAVINIANLNDAGPLSAGDFFHISQSGADFKVTLDDLASKFGEVDIFGLNEEPSISASDFIAFVDVSVGTDISSNRKVSFQDVADFVQLETFFTTDTDVDLDDKIIYRKDDEDELKQITTEDLRDKILTFTDLPSVSEAVTAERFALYNSTTEEIRQITRNNLQKSMLDATSLNSESTIENADKLYMYDDSASEPKQISYLDFLNKVNADVDLTTYLRSDINDTAAGTIDFTNGVVGFNVDRFGSVSAGGITITDNVTIQSTLNVVDVNATNTYGNIRLQNPSERIYSEESEFTFRTSESNTNTNTETNTRVFTTFETFEPTEPDACLGTVGNEWKKAHIDEAYLNRLRVDTRAYLPQATYVNQVALMDGSELNPALLPAATVDDFGTLKKSDWTKDSNEGQSFSSNQAMTETNMKDAYGSSAGTANDLVVRNGSGVVVGSARHRRAFRHLMGWVENTGQVIFGSAISMAPAANKSLYVEVPFNVTAQKEFTSADTYTVTGNHLVNGPDLENAVMIGWHRGASNGTKARIWLHREGSAAIARGFTYIAIGRT